jgi:DNA-binding NarL/FixJ family response regulator
MKTGQRKARKTTVSKTGSVKRKAASAGQSRAGVVRQATRPEQPTVTTLLLVDDHEMVRQGLKALLRDASQIAVVGEAGTMADAVKEAARLKPTVVLMDLRLPDGSGVEACRDIRSKDKTIRVIFLSSVQDEEAVLSSVAAGADGYLLKDISGPALVGAIDAVAAGRSILDPSVTQRVLDRMRTGAASADGGMAEELSPQERRVVQLVTEGKTNKEIAAAMHLSPKTVRNYLSNIFQKLHVTRRSQAAVLYTKRYPT